MTDREALRQYILAKQELRDLEERAKKPAIPLHTPMEKADYIAIDLWQQRFERRKEKPLRVISQAENAVDMIQDKADREMLQRIYFDGQPVYEVAEAMGYCERSIYYHLKAALTYIDKQEAARAESIAAAEKRL